MRQRSIVGPIILILVGALFLANNLRPDVPMFRWLSMYWPFLLIAWGLLRLIEIFINYKRGLPPPRHGLGGGEVVLIVFVCLIGSAMYAANKHIPRLRIGPWGAQGVEMFGEQFDYTLNGDLAASNVKIVVVENNRGNVRLTGSDTPSIRVTGRKTIRAYNKSDADTAQKETPFEMVQQGDRVVIRTNLDRVSGDRRISADIEVSAPKGVSFQARGRYGDYDITDVDGGVDISSDNAGVRLNRIGGDVKVDLRRSDIVRAVGVKGQVTLLGRGGDVELEDIAGQVSVNGAYSGDLVFKNIAKPLHFESRQTDFRVERLPGQVRIDLGDINAKDLVGPIRLVTKSRDVTLEKFTNSLEIELERGDVQLRPGNVPLAKMDIRSRSGNLEVSVPAAAKFEIKASTGRGEAHNDYGAPLQVETTGAGSAVKGVVGQGPVIAMAVDRGSVRVRKE